METRRLIFAIVVAFAVYIISSMLIARFVPQSRPQPTETEHATPGDIQERPAETPPRQPEQPPTPTSTTSRAAQASAFAWRGGEAVAEPIELGGAGDSLKVRFSQNGGSVSHIWLTERKKGKLVHSAGPKEDKRNEPYELLSPVSDRVGGGGAMHYSFATPQIVENNRQVNLPDQPWEVARESDHKVVFSITQMDPDAEGKPRLRITKTYELVPGKPLLNLTVAIENMGTEDLDVILAQDGPIGIRKEHLQYDMRHLMSAARTEGTVEAGVTKKRSELKKAIDGGSSIKLAPVADGEFLWTALTNKFFAVFTRPLQREGDTRGIIAGVSGLVAAVGRDDNPGDLLGRFITVEEVIGAGKSATYSFEICAGPKDPTILEKINPRYVDEKDLGYQIARAADYRCCTFQPLPQIMSWLVRKIQVLVRNYGLAIIILVIIVRTIMHPLTVFQQKSMFRMQDAMATLKPKMDALKEKFANDKVRMNQEMMKLYSEENVNPAAGMVGMLPLFIQMPILVALWQALNTDVLLRNAPFIFWIDDLSSPDALYTFAGDGINLPLISWMFGPVKSLNLVPILMGISMWLQQKYMPKPGQQAKRDAAKKQPPAPRKKGQGMTPEDQARQQQMIMNMMSILFPLLFYRMPSGLTLYWMATNVFGICESLIIRKQIREEKERREKEGPKPRKPKKQGMVSRFFKHLADQAEELQKKADTLADKGPGGKSDKDKPGGKPPKKRK